MKKKKVSVVGGGLAGLATAYALSKNTNVEVDLFETQAFLGGRIQSRMIRGQSIDFGGFLIYPWYTQCLSLIRELGLSDELAKTPLKDIYYSLRAGEAPLTMGELPFSTLEGLKIWSKAFFKLFPEADVAQPDLDRFGQKTISDYLRETLGTAGHAGLYETYFDTVSQGYCYGPITTTKAAFMAPIVRQTTLHGDIRSTSFFSRGTALLVDRLSDAIIAKGGRIHLNSPVTGVKGLTLHMGKRDQKSDVIVFAQNVTHDLFRQILPEVKPDCWYTHFLTAVIELGATPVVGGVEDWAAIFYAPEDVRREQVLSVINLSVLYGPSLERCIMANVVLRDDLLGAMGDPGIKKILTDELSRLFPPLKKAKVLDCVHWDVAMPVAQEDFVKAIRKRQGKDDYYFAGDYLGAPSIETAISTGLSAAKHVLSSILD
ncbi:FAD-dependent oxidoreductase [Candidatus Peregrinibacteria bacterium]|nr:FAD-dependent oxidoreductase [Candidatus Peregrinibacteria bacterium]